MKRKISLAVIAFTVALFAVKASKAEDVKIYNCPDGSKHCTTIYTGGGGKDVYHKGN